MTFLSRVNRVRVLTATTGTGSSVALGAAVSNIALTPAEAGMVDGATYRYEIVQGADYEEQVGVYTASGTTLARNTPKDSKVGGTHGTTKITLDGSAIVRVISGMVVADMEVPRAHCGGRLTLTSGTPVMGSDVTGATSIYLAPSGQGAGRATGYDGTSWVSSQFAELTLALDSNSGHTGYHQSGKNFDVFLDTAGGIIGTGPAWSSDTARGTGAGTTELESFEGALVNKNSVTIRNGSNTYSYAARLLLYVGSFRATADGQTEDSILKRFLWNQFNEKPRHMRAVDATVNWSYAAGTSPGWRQANANSANQVQALIGVAGRPVSISVHGQGDNASGPTIRMCAVGVGVNSTSANSAQLLLPANASNTAALTASAHYDDCPAIGLNTFAWLETRDATDNILWFGSVLQIQTGIRGVTHQ